MPTPQELADIQEAREAYKEYLSSVNRPTPQAEDRPLQALAQGIGETAMPLGLLPEAQTATESAVDKLSQLLGVGGHSADSKLRAAGIPIPSDQDHDQIKQSYYDRSRDLGESNPGSKFAGNAMGLVGGSMALPAAKVGALSNAAYGGIQGALTDPGGEGLQLGTRAANAGLGAILGAGAGALSKGAKIVTDKAGATKDLIKKVDEGYDLPGMVRDTYEKGKAVVQGKIDPLKQQVTEGLRGKTIEFNPNIINKDITPGLTRLAGQMESRAAPDTGRVLLDANRANRLRRNLDTRANWFSSNALDPINVAKSPKAELPANVIRQKLAEAAPEIVAPNAEVGRMSNLLGKLNKQMYGDAPISATRASVGTDEYALLKQFAKDSGVDLQQLGSQIEHAADLSKGGYREFAKKLGLMPEVRRRVERAAINTGAALHGKIPTSSQAPLLQGLFEANQDNGPTKK